MKPPAYPIIPPAAPGWWGAFCDIHGLNVYHPEQHPELARLAFAKRAEKFGWTQPYPPRNPYRTCPCHPFHAGVIGGRALGDGERRL